ncbi:uncharacterized protein PFL1_06149 [Pseudozyma flocculosa PF-1]|uniref:Uncharacterized protein n=2 Tax=Pseudozyma flocculosa TaxID=84751 RepID=A0A5C3F9W3_9BASI|nr:uncharacterized protein PFL1_06149 [Pseudozyma flocculosa PF-1]EPQ26214.1 hypothetical protein PFL1_06149 [Pseudozyma flocculosa PF-1]SPO40169.1 uncharacterized protein PSFLO_05651 [Pseudozyma flocculosa]
MSSQPHRRPQGQHDDLLSQYDDLDTPLDTQDQERLIAQLKQQNDGSNYGLRALLAVLIALLEFLYLTPLPSYIRGDHPENHLTLYHHPVHVEGTIDHLTYLPALPIYLFFFLVHGSLLYMAAIELLSTMGHANLLARYRLPLARSTANAVPFPYQPHPFGTAPAWLVPTLRDIKWSTSPQTKLNQRADDQPAATAVAKSVASSLSDPKLLYLWFLFIASWPMPMLIFGAGNFANAAWWSLSSAVLGIYLAAETWIAKTNRDILGLDALKYNHKSA